VRDVSRHDEQRLYDEIFRDSGLCLVGVAEHIRDPLGRPTLHLLRFVSA
jgi:hypothetical protein